MCKVEADYEKKYPDAEIGNPVDVFGEEVRDDGRKDDPGGDVDGLA